MAEKVGNGTKYDQKKTLEMSSHKENLECFTSINVPKINTSKRRAVRNALILSFAYFLFFTGFWPLSNLQSTMNADQGIGVDSQAVIYLCSMVSCFLPDLLIGKFGTKSTYAVALFLGLPYIAANFSPRWDAMIISSVLFGLVSGPMNAAVTVYLDEMSLRFAASAKESQENVRAFFFGLYMVFGELTQVAGNSVSYFILQKGRTAPPQNFSASAECGVRFDPEAATGVNTNLDPPTDLHRYMVTGTFLLFGVLAVVTALLLDPLKNDIKEVKGCYTVTQKVSSALRHLTNPHQLLLLPITIYVGIRGSFYSADFTQAYIACSWGVHHIGFVTICLGLCGAIMSILVGPLVKCVSQTSVIISASVVNGVATALLFVWQPSPDVPAAYFAFAGVFGITDAIWWSQIGALYGEMFPKDREAAFSNFFFWSFLGYFLSYFYANHLNVATKISIMLVILIIGISLYVVGQIKLKCFSSKKSRSSMAIIESVQNI